jgi:AdoMet-dependent heme synthase
MSARLQGMTASTVDFDEGQGPVPSRMRSKGGMKSFDFNQHPFLVIWEVTRACALACRHCRAEVQSRRHPLELSTWEAFGLIDQIARAHPALFVLTGGDPIRQPDFKDLIHYATQRGLRVGLTPSVTPAARQTKPAAMCACSE